MLLPSGANIICENIVYTQPFVLLADIFVSSYTGWSALYRDARF